MLSWKYRKGFDMKDRFDYTPQYDEGDYVQPFSDEQYGITYQRESHYEQFADWWDYIWEAKAQMSLPPSDTPRYHNEKYITTTEVDVDGTIVEKRVYSLRKYNEMMAEKTYAELFPTNDDIEGGGDDGQILVVE